MAACLKGNVGYIANQLLWFSYLSNMGHVIVPAVVMIKTNEQGELKDSSEC